MKFGFLPYLNEINISEEITNIIDTLRTITWEQIEKIIKQALLTLQLIKNGSINILITQLSRSESLELWEIYWTTINKSYISFFKEYKTKYESPFIALENFDRKKCKMFIDWLELYSISKTFFIKNTYKLYKENRSIENIIIPQKNRFIHFYDNFSKIIWRIDNLQISSELKNNQNKYKYINIDHVE
jgi:hypothetical protein